MIPYLYLICTLSIPDTYLICLANQVHMMQPDAMLKVVWSTMC